MKSISVFSLVPVVVQLIYCGWNTFDPFAIIGYHDFDHRLMSRKP